MEATMYDEGRSSAKRMKLEMSLDLQSPDQFKKLIKQENSNEVLCTPDLGMFMLASPDLERFIMQQNGMVLTTPTPTSQILFPKSVTEEQEAYARGFMDALGELHRNNGKSVTTAPQTTTTTLSIPTALNLSYQPADEKQKTVLTTLDKKPVINNQKIIIQQKPITIAPSDILIEEVPPAAVYTTLRTSKPRVATNRPLIFHSSTPQTQQAFPARSAKAAPVVDPEEAKLEKKRARNRLAATRCRNRKLERISRLEDRVAELKGENGDLASTAATLREEVFRLKQCIIELANQGCHVMINHNLLV